MFKRFFSFTANKAHTIPPPCYRFLQKQGADGQETTSSHTLPACDLEGVSPQGPVSLHPSAESLGPGYLTTAAPRSRQEPLERRKDFEAGSVTIIDVTK